MTNYFKKAKNAFFKMQRERLETDRKFLRNGQKWDFSHDEYLAFIKKHMAHAKERDQLKDDPTVIEAHHLPATKPQFSAMLEKDPTLAEISARTLEIIERVSGGGTRSYLDNDRESFSAELKQRDPERWEQICAIPIGGFRGTEEGE